MAYKPSPTGEKTNLFNINYKNIYYHQGQNFWGAARYNGCTAVYNKSNAKKMSNKKRTEPIHQ
jgi:predicted ribonuclease toxin of YeeF-YezG toxin-antitoxin module